MRSQLFTQGNVFYLEEKCIMPLRSHIRGGNKGATAGSGLSWGLEGEVAREGEWPAGIKSWLVLYQQAKKAG